MSGNSSLDTSESKFLVLISASCHTYNHTYANDFLGLQVGRCILHVIILIIVVRCTHCFSHYGLPACHFVLFNISEGPLVFAHFTLHCY